MLLLLLSYNYIYNTIITHGGHFNTSVDGEITITNITNEDNGTYTCIVSNDIGSGLYQQSNSL